MIHVLILNNPKYQDYQLISVFLLAEVKLLTIPSECILNDPIASVADHQ